MINAEFTTEQKLSVTSQPHIDEFWLTGTFSNFKGVDNIAINFASFQCKDNKKCLIIVPGRAESYLKYQELAYHFFNEGYDLFIIDHRGQGTSERLLSNKHKGHVNSFQDYADDLNTFITRIVIPQCLPNTKPYLLAHSMGCAISCLALASTSHLIQAAVLSSPMLAINTGKLPPWLARLLVNIISIVEYFSKNKGNYFPGQKNHYFKTFDKNKLTHSKIRFERFNNLYQQQSQLRLGGVTTCWLKEALAVEAKITALLAQITTPIQVLQAESDSIVDNQAQLRFCRQLHRLQHQSCPQAAPVIINNAFHELFFEQDSYRKQAITATLTWFEQHKR